MGALVGSQVGQTAGAAYDLGKTVHGLDKQDRAFLEGKVSMDSGKPTAGGNRPASGKTADKPTEKRGP